MLLFVAPYATLNKLTVIPMTNTGYKVQRMNFSVIVSFSSPLIVRHGPATHSPCPS